jgi:type II secretory pathway pseudopilin PulG
MWLNLSRSRTLAALSNQRGAMLMVVLVAVVIMGLGSAMAGMSWQAAAQRAKEAELLWVGQQYVRALESYYDADFRGGARRPPGSSGADPSGPPAALPQHLEELVRDPRAAQVVRHLRKLYLDPMTGEDFELLRDPSGRIRGVRSTSTLKPFRSDGFPRGLERLVGASRYNEWEFVFDAPTAGTSGGVHLDGQVPTLDPTQLPSEQAPPRRTVGRPDACLEPTPCPPGETCIFDPEKCAFIPYKPSWIGEQ